MTTTISNLLTDLTVKLDLLVEKAARPGVLGIKGRRIEKRAQKELQSYFKKLGDDIVALHLEDRAIANGEMASHVVEIALHNVLRKQTPHLVSILKTNMQDAFAAAATMKYVAESYDPSEDRDERGMWTSGGGVLTAHGAGGASVEELSRKGVNFKVTKSGSLTYLGKQVDATLKPGEALVAIDKKSGSWEVRDGSHDTAKLHISKVKAAIGLREADRTGLDQVGLSAVDAANYAEEHAAGAVTGINKTTQGRIASAVAQGIENQLGAGGTARLIREIVDDMASNRALVIASTEMNYAMSFAALRKMNNMGVEYKRIILSDDACPICQDNAAVDPIPVDETYPSGDDAPAFHPNCRCAITAARNPDIAEAYKNSA